MQRQFIRVMTAVFLLIGLPHHTTALTPAVSTLAMRGVICLSKQSHEPSKESVAHYLRYIVRPPLEGNKLLSVHLRTYVEHSDDARLAGNTALVVAKRFLISQEELAASKNTKFYVPKVIIYPPGSLEPEDRDRYIETCDAGGIPVYLNMNIEHGPVHFHAN